VESKFEYASTFMLVVIRIGGKAVEEVKKKLLEAAPNGKIPCVMAFKIARECNCAIAEVGELCNDLKIKIINCQLGFFGE
jgi:hypothetical protein